MPFFLRTQLNDCTGHKPSRDDCRAYYNQLSFGIPGAGHIFVHIVCNYILDTKDQGDALMTAKITVSYTVTEHRRLACVLLSTTGTAVLRVTITIKTRYLLEKRRDARR